MTRKALSYLRVSTTGQAHEEKWGYDRQRREVLRYAGENDLELIAEHRDAISGTTVTRTGLEALKVNPHSRVLLISSIDRLARDVSASYKVLAELIDAGFEVHSADFGLIDLADDMALVQFNFRALFANLEHRAIAKRTRASHLAMAEKGLLPTGIKTYGYLNDSGKAVQNPAQARIVRMIFTWSAEGKTQWWIQEELNRQGVPVPRPSQRRSMPVPLWHRTVVAKLLHNCAYKGEYHWGKYTIAVPPIVSDELWEAAQPKKRGRRPTSGFPLVGHLRCGVCGRRMQARAARRRASGSFTPQYYRCQSGTLPTGPCGAGGLNRERLERAAETLLRDTLGERATLERFLERNRKPDMRLSDALAEIEVEDARWLEAFRLGAVSPAELAAHRAEAEAKRRALQQNEPSSDYQLDTYLEAAKSYGFAELLRLSNAMFIASSERLDLVQE